MTTARDAVTRYLDLVNQHETEQALDCLADDFELRFAGSEHAMPKEAASAALGWDAGVRGMIEWRPVESGDSRLVIEGRESNEFLRLLGIDSLGFRSTYEINDEGRIRVQVHEVHWGGANLEASLQPLIEWAREHEPEELEAIYPEGRMIYSREMGERWLALAQRWKKDGDS